MALAVSDPTAASRKLSKLSPIAAARPTDLETPFFGAALIQQAQAYKVALAAALDGTPHEALTIGQIHLLMALSRHQPCTQTRIVDATGMDRSTLADVMRRLKAKKLIERRRTKEDARAYAVTLTAEGRKALQFVTPIVQRIDKRLRGQAVDFLRLA